MVPTDPEAARLEERHLGPFFQLSLDLLCIAGTDGYFKRINPAFSRTLGWSEEELLGRPWLDFVHPDDHNATASIVTTHLAMGIPVLVFENRYRRPDGSYRWLAWNSVPLPGTELIYAIARDVTEAKRIEQEVRDANLRLDAAVRSERQAHEALKQAQGQLVQSEKLVALGQMVAGVAHEVNNPLAFVSNNLAVLQRDTAALAEMVALYRRGESAIAAAQPDLAAQLTALGQRIDLDYTLDNLAGLIARSRDGLKRIQQIVRDLRDFARLDENVVHETDLNPGIESTVNIVRGLAQRRGVELHLDLAPLPLLECQPGRLNQVVMNLVTNALDASCWGQAVRIATRATDDEIQIEVADDGSGIEPAILDRIFDPFFTTKPPGQGTGLGLSISYGIVKDHHGHITVDSRPKEGTRFVVHLPRRPAGPADPGVKP